MLVRGNEIDLASLFGRVQRSPREPLLRHGTGCRELPTREWPSLRICLPYSCLHNYATVHLVQSSNCPGMIGI